MELNEQLLRDAVEIVTETLQVPNFHCSEFQGTGSVEFDDKFSASLQTLIDLAELVLGVNGVMPERGKEYDSDTVTDTVITRAENEIIDQCVLAVVGRFVGLEDVIWKHEDELSDGYKFYGGDAGVKRLATAIAKHIVGKI